MATDVLTDVSKDFSKLRYPQRTVTCGPNRAANVKVIPTGKALGAVIEGVDLSQPVDKATADILRRAWDDHLVVLFRDQFLTPGQYRDAAAIFGRPQEGANRKYIRAAGLAVQNEFPEIEILSNLDKNGVPVLNNDGLGSVEVVWHSDNSYIEAPPMGSCLYSLEVPPYSGNTSFSNQYLAYETLPRDLAEEIKGLRAKHDASRNSAGVLRPGLKIPSKPEDVPGPFHPLVVVHPRTGRLALFLGRRRIYPSQFIEGYSNGASEALLDRLWEHATREELSWMHRWRVGDLLVWDNRCAMHRRDPVDVAYRRVMLRTQFQGETPIPA